MLFALFIDALSWVGAGLGIVRFIGATIFATLEPHTGYNRAIAICSAGIAACVYLGIKTAFPRIAAYVPQPSAPTTWADSLIAGRTSHGQENKHFDHVWVKGDLLFLDKGQGPSYCNACSTLVVQGLCCLVCRRCSHAEHLDLVKDMPCKKMYAHSNIPKLLRMRRQGSKDSITSTTSERSSVTEAPDAPSSTGSSATTPIPSSPPAGHSEYSEHQWVEGNLSLDARCVVCAGSAGSEPTLKDMRCIWCDVSVHTACFTQYRRKCMLGLIPHLVVPPPFVTRISSAARGSSKKPDPRFTITSLPEGVRPLLCIVNPASGAQNSGALLRGLFSMLNPVQVIDTSQENPEALIRAFEPVIDRCRLLACGGDGTIQWAFSILDKVVPAGKKKPPVGVLPLGTGNDLARVLGWGGGWTGTDITEIVREIDAAVEVSLDRWTVGVLEIPSRTLSSTAKVGRALKLTSMKKPKITHMNNYFSLGSDASVALDFHTTRLKQPQLFKNRLLNKVWYALLGAKHQTLNVLSIVGLVRSPSSASIFDEDESPATDTSKEEELMPSPAIHEPLSASTLYIDRKPDPIDLTDVGALIVLNIPSYGGGGKIYAAAEADGHPKSLYTDQKLEVLTVASPMHLGASVLGLSSPTVIGQAKEIRVHVDAPEIAMQVDGEPWLQKGPAEVTIKFLGASSMLRKVDDEDDEDEEDE
ncbi:diacylglycerol kinase (ATP) [Powellomyces hirtus]|uniref:Diacylglycerol kinase n=1 Tax=Powellomyces hirtus TaxID=109895 RepID=A0A507DUQ2_9FUNG|nr:diacylglycerol kinase (ATP) [Powellomyces hirtus]